MDLSICIVMLGRDIISQVIYVFVCISRIENAFHVFHFK